MISRVSSLVALAFMASIGLSACGDADDVEEVEVEEDGEVEVDD